MNIYKTSLPEQPVFLRVLHWEGGRSCTKPVVLTLGVNKTVMSLSSVLCSQPVLNLSRLVCFRIFYESILDYYSDVTGFTEVGRAHPLALRYEIRIAHSRSMALILYVLELNMGESQKLCNIMLSVFLHIAGMRNVIHRLRYLKTGSPAGSDI